MAYLVGTNFSGSTVFGQALGAHSSIRYLGEMDRLHGFPPTAWAAQGEPPCHWCELHRQACPVWTPERRSKARQGPPGALMDFVAGEFGEPVLVDGSKHPSWLRAVLADESSARERIVTFLTVRSPFAFCDSFRFRTGCQIWEAANIWRDVYVDATRQINRAGLPVQVVRYEAFALDPERVLRASTTLLGVDYEPEMLQFQHRPRHDVGGNYNVLAAHDQLPAELSRERFRAEMPESWGPGRQQSHVYWGKQFGGWVDDKWQVNMSDADIEQVLQTPGLADVAVLLGYELTREVAAWQNRRASDDRITTPAGQEARTAAAGARGVGTADGALVAGRANAAAGPGRP